MDYEKKYKSALTWMQSLYSGLHGKTKEEAEKHFPELKESENDIMKELLTWLKDIRTNPSVGFSTIKMEQWIDWLEKLEGCEHIKEDQLEHLKQSWYREGFIYGKSSSETSKDKERTINDAATLKELIDFLENGTAKSHHDLTRYANWLKIQFPQIEKQGEHKPADRVEPKFHEGDWLIHQGTENTYQVVARIDNQYQLKYDDNYTVQKCADVDRCARLWTIQDARTGDVLATDYVVFIFDYVENNWVSMKCYYAKSFRISSIPKLNADYVYPATKERRDILFQKMHEAGYELDIEKKELKKIINEKQIRKNLQDNSFRRMFEQDKKDLDIINGMIIDYMGKIEHTAINEQDKHIYQERINFLNWLKLYCPQSYNDIQNQKKIDDAIYLIEHYESYGHNKNLRKKVIDGLEYLKQLSLQQEEPE